MRRYKAWWIASCACALLFLGLTASVLWIDVAAVGPLESRIGLSSLNVAVRDAVGQNEEWYHVSEWLGYLSLASVGGFGLFGFCQWIRRKRLLAVDRDLFCVAGAYGLIAVLYVLFEIIAVNFRPVLMDGALEASFPSSHTMLVIGTAGVAAHQFLLRIRASALRWSIALLWIAVALGTTVGRMLSGVHWFTDILGGVLIGLAVLFAYLGAADRILEITANGKDKGETYDKAGV